VKIRIKARPREHEIDGVALGTLVPGSVLDVSSSLGLWLVARGYAQPEMRRDAREATTADGLESANDGGRRRRYSDRPKIRS
jgi:hypothetical protein